ncbi:hypothetical protein EN904_12225 [Mesorhizobium sp. M7A.F.Ca.CA.001.07.2.1]|nr:MULTISPECIES: hypothetical protein [Mesorhizobium]RUY88139.1 hypothetical protein EN964_15360 [Mesorhizobium sp. M7A.F.Ca.CA.001.10.2.1]RVB16160.1 hypothetical protein EN918_34350 [Mesorhizobium sp. M7A.F.Ca.CA.004.05.1.1]MCF6126042.1 hypothetical protein [Mesorhizobium ciceri]MCQ8813923.1 hypothetical protein [Mesorhizobium sp. SEMIA396]RUX81422.1 hypothetical protein EN983_04570 [Mesorhizobium sp. M7A.F.Ca.CA.004.08.2.1]
MTEFTKHLAFARADALELRSLLKRTEDIPPDQMAAHLAALRVQHAMIGRDLDRLQKAVPAFAKATEGRPA